MASSPAGAPAPGADRAAPPSARERLNLIDQITSASVASDYADVPDQPPAGSRRQRVLVAGVALGLAGFVLALGISERVLNDPVVNDQRTALAERIDAADARNGGLIEEVAAGRVELNAAREDYLRVTVQGALLATQIRTLEVATGYAPVEGPGAVVTLTDAPVTEGEEDEDIERVLDSDIQRAVNGLVVRGSRGDRGQRPAADRTVRDPVGGWSHPRELQAAQAAVPRGGDRPP